jgi:hypothetical protein
MVPEPPGRPGNGPILGAELVLRGYGTDSPVPWGRVPFDGVAR